MKNKQDPDFSSELRDLINRRSMENASNTPDFILAQYLTNCLRAWNQATQQRETWYGRDATVCAMKEPDCSDVLAAEVRKLRAALKDANDLCRSAYQVAMREGRATNWQSFRACLSESLDRQHRVMYPPKAQGRKCDL